MKKLLQIVAGAIWCMLHSAPAWAQTEIDGIMMYKNNFCFGTVYTHSSWDQYWEGNFKRENANLGSVTTQMLGVMGNYGISNKLNVLFGVPYVQTKASAGQLNSMKGVQDLSLWIKWMPVQTNIGKGSLTLYGVGGYTFPLTDYTPDFLPMSIGLRSKTLSLRGMIDYEVNNLFATLSGTYMFRDNIKIDRDNYYTTEMHYTNEVKMPNAAQFNFRLGYRSERLIAEAVINQFNTLGGFDITKNNMPFPSNKMNATMVGPHFKYNFKKPHGLSLVGGADYTVAGRNMGQATSFSAGVFYVIHSLF